MFDSKPLIQKLLRRMENSAMTQNKFAVLLGVTSSVITKWKKGQGNYNPTLERIAMVADKLDTTITELLTPESTSADTPAKSTETTPEKKTKATRTAKSKKAETPVKESKTKAATKTSAAKSKPAKR